MEMCVYEIDSRLEECKAFTADVEQFAREKKLKFVAALWCPDYLCACLISPNMLTGVVDAYVRSFVRGVCVFTESIVVCCSFKIVYRVSASQHVNKQENL